MKTILRRTLSVLLCLVLLCGTAAVGGEGLARVLASLTVRASAQSGDKQLDVTQEEAVQWALDNYSTVTGAYYDPENYYGEGVSLAKNYIYYALGVRGSAQDGQIIFAEHTAAGAVRTQDIIDHFEILDNTHDPLPGDMFVWDYYYNPYGDMLWTEEYGQIGIITAVSKTTYTAVNWNGWEGNTHDRSSLILKPKQAGMFTAGLHDFSALIRPQFKQIPPLQKDDVIEFGSYPQTKVTDSGTISALNGTSGAWTEYRYYHGTGDRFDGKSLYMPYFMYFKDVEKDGVRYRGVKFTEYRPAATGLDFPAYNSTGTIQYKNGYRPDTVYWFRWEPLRWRVLDLKTGLVLCESVIDSQPYHNTLYLSEKLNGSDIYRGTTLGLPDYNPFASDYEKSDLRTYLLHDLFNAAFDEAQQGKIRAREITGIPFALNAAGHPEFSTANQFTLKDKVFLLSGKDVFYTDAFSDAASRQAKGSDYAKCQGLDVSASGGSAAWWLFPTTPYGSGQVYFAKPDGENPVAGFVDITSCGVRPAMQLDLTSIPPAEPQADASGSCGANGDNVKWYWYEDSGLLTINGTGAMANYSSSGSMPWRTIRDRTKSVVIYDGVTSIGSYAFDDYTNLASVTIPDSVTSIGQSAFSWCTSLASVTIPDSVTSIGDWAFYGCRSLASVTIGNSVTSIGYMAFYRCTSLASVTIGNSVTSIEDGAFCDCTSLASVTIPDSVTSIWDHAFYNCTSLTAINVDARNTVYCSDASGVLYNKEKTKLIQYPIGNARTTFAIPNGVTSIGNYAFYNCTSLASVTIPDSVTSIVRWAFCNCTSLASVTIPDSVTSIGGFAFSDCTSLASVTIGNSVTSIGNGAFHGCTSLTSVTIPDSVTGIGEEAFCDCTSLASVTIPDSVTIIVNGAFHGCTSLTDVYYDGSEADRQSITIVSGNDPLLNAAWHYNYVDPNPHTHAFGAEWLHDAANHWHACACGEKESVGAHTFDSVITKPATKEQPGVVTYTCKVCGYQKTETIPSLPNPHDLPETDLIQGNAANNQKTYAYRASVTFTANVPEGGSVQWYVDGQPAGNGATLTVGDKKESYTVTVVVTAPDGTQTMDEEHVTIQNSFWAKVVWFFRHLFFPAKYRIKQ